MSHAEELPELTTLLEIGGDSNPSQTATSASVPWPWSNISPEKWGDVAQDGNAGQNSTSTINVEAPTFHLTRVHLLPNIAEKFAPQDLETRRRDSSEHRSLGWAMGN